MKLALIPPYARLADIRHTRYQLGLAHLVDHNPLYTEAFKIVCKSKEHYVILDNGAFEGSLVDSGELLDIADRYKVDEVVIPDRIRNASVSMELAKSFRKMYENNPYHRMKLMFVVQGASWYEMNACVQWAMDQKWIDTIAIPRHTLETCMDATARLTMASYIEANSNQDIHFLGASPLWPGEIKEAAQLGSVRGMDTSMPYVYAIAGHEWSVESEDFVDSSATRDVYFETLPNEAQDKLMDLNIERMLANV